MSVCHLLLLCAAVPAEPIIKPVVNNAPAASAGSSAAKQSRLRSVGVKETRPAPLVRACARKVQSAVQASGKSSTQIRQSTEQPHAPPKTLTSQSATSIKPPCTDVKEKVPLGTKYTYMHKHTDEMPLQTCR